MSGQIPAPGCRSVLTLQQWIESVRRGRKQARRSGLDLYWNVPLNQVPLGLRGPQPWASLKRFSVPNPEKLARPKIVTLTETRQSRVLEWLARRHESASPLSYRDCPYIPKEELEAALWRGVYGVTNEHLAIAASDDLFRRFDVASL